MKETQINKIKGNAGHYKVIFPDLTEGELLALHNALNNYKSVVGQDVKGYLSQTLSKMDFDWI